MLPPHIQALVLDMDGVLWKGDTPLGDLEGLFGQLATRGIRFAFATNNATLTPERYVERLAAFGVEVQSAQVVTSATATAEILGRSFAPGTPVFAIGEEGLMAALHGIGLAPVAFDQADAARAVVMGMDRNISFEKMRTAALLVGKGRPFFATNPDRSFPTPDGEVPGAGAWVSVVSTATGVEPVFAGKPHPLLIELALKALGTTKAATLVVGDRLETDIAAGQACGCACALVLSGVSTAAQAAKWRPAIEFVAADLWSLIDGPVDIRSGIR
jgi:4-nitrophenyl phosphatase